MINFDPKHIGCPICNTKSNHYHSYQSTAHKRINDEKLIGYGCGHEFTLFDALRSECQKGGLFGILSCFSHCQAYKSELITAGKINIISIPTPDDHTIFSIFMSQQGRSPHKDALCAPKIIATNKDEIVVSCAALKNVPNELLGNPINMNISVYGYYSKDAPGWKKLFYEGIHDYSENNYSMSVFKLATSVEGYCETTVGNYLNSKNIGIGLSDRILKSSRGWNTIINYFSEISNYFLSKRELLTLKESVDFFNREVRPFRNKFAHDNPDSIGHDGCDKAFENAFSIFWCMDRVNKALNKASYSER